MVCAEISKVVLCIINGAFLLASLAMFGLGIALVVDPQGLISFANSFGLDFSVVSEVTDQQFANIIKAGGYFMIVLGVIIAIISLMGFCGACCGSTCLLIVYSIFIVVIIAAQIALVIFVVLFPSTLTDKGADVMKEALHKGFKNDVQISQTGMISNGSLTPADVAWMVVQVKVKCCGGSGIDDYDEVNWEKCGDIKCDAGPGPVSCCKLSNSSTSQFPTSTSDFQSFDLCMTRGTIGRPYRNEVGCAEAIVGLANDAFEKSRNVVIVIAAIVIAIEIALIIMSCVVIRD